LSRILVIGFTAVVVLACTGEVTPSPDPSPVAGPEPTPTPEPKGKGKRKAGGGGGRQAGESDPQPKIPATGTPDPLAGLSSKQICERNELLMVKYSYEDLQGGKCNDVCCTDPAADNHWCCSLDWPSSDVMLCHEYAVMRNGIFARYGYPFTEEEWKKMFADAPFYRRREDFDASWLSAMAKKNVDSLKKMEETKTACINE
jgi:hypothetical protein